MTMSAATRLNPAWLEELRSDVEPFAEGGFDIVPEAAIAEFRERLNRRIGTGQGRLIVIEHNDPTP